MPLSSASFKTLPRPKNQSSDHVCNRHQFGHDDKSVNKNRERHDPVGSRLKLCLAAVRTVLSCPGAILSWSHDHDKARAAPALSPGMKLLPLAFSCADWSDGRCRPEFESSHPSQPSLRVMSRQNAMSRPFRDMSHVRQSLERELRPVLSSNPRSYAPVSGRRIRISKFSVQRLGST
jgi:hypothetical protein